MKRVSGSMKLDLAQFREMAAFSQFASDLDASTKKLLARGARLTEMLKQPQYHPLPVEEEVAAIFAGVRGFLDSVELSQIAEFEQRALQNLRTNHGELLKDIAEQKVISDETEAKLTAFYQDFVKQFTATSGQGQAA